MSPSEKFSVPSVIIAASMLVGAHITDNTNYALAAIPFAVVAAIFYILAPQINWAFYRKKPPAMPRGLWRFLETQVTTYQKMHPFDRKRFRDGIMLFMEATDWKVQVSDEFPSDMKVCVAGSAVQLLMTQDDYVFPKFETVILYPHPFPSPQFPEYWHHSEIYKEDGAILFAAQSLLRGFMHPEKYYPIGLHEYARIFVLTYPNFDYPLTEADFWDQLPLIGGYTQEIIIKTIGLPDVDPLAVAIVHYHIFGEGLKKVRPQMYEQLSSIFSKKDFNPEPS